MHALPLLALHNWPLRDFKIQPNTQLIKMNLWNSKQAWKIQVEKIQVLIILYDVSYSKNKYIYNRIIKIYLN